MSNSTNQNVDGRLFETESHKLPIVASERLIALRLARIGLHECVALFICDRAENVYVKARSALATCTDLVRSLRGQQDKRSRIHQCLREELRIALDELSREPVNLMGQFRHEVGEYLLSNDLLECELNQ